MLGTPIQLGNFDFANKEVPMANNVIQPVTHSSCVAGNIPSWKNFHSLNFSCDLRHLIFIEKVVNRHAYGEILVLWILGLQITLYCL